ncbi:N-acyl homoserine lactonase family protein [Halorubrum tibetense]|uniref:N-acyl homoserine lactonase family protein n=1 Tax=Halorubrum tibetense TaxID=175631 RepID=A0ABD5SDY6_9EURY
MVDAEVHVIDRGGIRCDMNYMLEGHVLATREEPNPDSDYGEIPVWNLVIDHPEGTILWDTGSHHDAADGHWPDDLVEAFDPYDASDHRLDDDLAAAGYAVEDIDAVFVSHLHIDHAGGLEFFAGTDTPIYAHEEELQFAYYDAKVGADDGGYLLSDFDHDLNWRPLYRDHEEHFTDLEFVRLPGHTPGLTGSVLHLDDEGTLVFAGDQAYMRANYEAEVPLGGPLLWGKTEWRESLRRLQSIERRHDAAVVFGHDADQFESMRPGWGV